MFQSNKVEVFNGTDRKLNVKWIEGSELRRESELQVDTFVRCEVGEDDSVTVFDGSSCVQIQLMSEGTWIFHNCFGDLYLILDQVDISEGQVWFAHIKDKNVIDSYTHPEIPFADLSTAL